MSGGHFVLAYHGCDITVRDGLVSGRNTGLKPSDNDYDWLGKGAYFFEDDPQRAIQFAQAAHAQPEKRYTKFPIATPAVVGAVLRIGAWLDMTTQRGLTEFREAHDRLELALGRQNMPRNAPADGDDADVILRKLDRAVFDALHAQRQVAGLSPYDAVRGAFQQGPDLVESSAFKKRSHIQIALLTLGCVEGWFLVPGDVPLLDAPQLVQAEADLTAAKASLSGRKRRQRPL